MLIAHQLHETLDQMYQARHLNKPGEAGFALQGVALAQEPIRGYPLGFKIDPRQIEATDAFARHLAEHLQSLRSGFLDDRHGLTDCLHRPLHSQRTARDRRREPVVGSGPHCPPGCRVGARPQPTPPRWRRSGGFSPWHR